MQVQYGRTQAYCGLGSPSAGKNLVIRSVRSTLNLSLGDNPKRTVRPGCMYIPSAPSTESKDQLRNSDLAIPLHRDTVPAAARLGERTRSLGLRVVGCVSGGLPTSLYEPTFTVRVHGECKYYVYSRVGKTQAGQPYSMVCASCRAKLLANSFKAVSISAHSAQN